MAFKKTLVQRLFNLSRFSTPPLTRTQPIKQTPTQPKPTRPRPLHQSTDAAVMRLFPLNGAALTETLRGMDISAGRLTLDGLIARPNDDVYFGGESTVEKFTMSEVRKVMKASQVEMLRGKLSDVGKDWVSYGEYVRVIQEFCGGNSEIANDFVKLLDDSGVVIVFGNSVCLRPHQVAKAIHSLVTPPVSMNPNDPRRKELEAMDEQKAMIDLKAEALVRRELWAGLGYMVVQTAAFMRLTFWELSWDVMEPICFYVTSAYFMIGYTFFLRTSKEPSFEGFYQSRFNAKQKRIMNTEEFDLKRYNELRKLFYSDYSSPTSSLDDSRLIKYDHYHEVN